MNELFVQLANGQDVVNDVIVDQMEMAKSLAVRFMQTNNSRSEDILSTAYMGLVHGVNWIYKHPEKDFDPVRLGSLLNTIVRRFIVDYLNDDTIIPIPRHTVADHLARGLELKRPLVFRWDITKDIKQFEVPDKKSSGKREALQSRIELDHHLTETQKTVLDLRMRGYNQYEIADMIGCSQPWINIIIGEIRATYTTLSVCERWPVSLS